MSRLPSVKEISVGLDFGESIIPVGRLATRKSSIYFEYEPDFIQRGIEISPLTLPLKTGEIRFKNNLFEGLPGVFNDSLPDGWGRLLFDYFFVAQGFVPSEITPLERLAYVGKSGMGALVYEPTVTTEKAGGAVNLDSIAQQVQDVLDGSSEEDFQALQLLNGSACGARPKVLLGVSKTRDRISHDDFLLDGELEPWLIKFPNNTDGPESGVIEYVYALMAKEAGIEMSDIHLFPASKCPGYFACKRFDRNGTKRFHMHSACGLMHLDIHTPSLDYTDLLALTKKLTHSNKEVEKMYRLAVFNIFAHNRDDHAKNFSFLMDSKGQWKLSPAYDLTFSSGLCGEQSTMIMGEGKNPGVEHVIKLGKEAKLTKSYVNEIVDQTRSALAAWPKLAKLNGVSDAKVRMIAKRFCANR